MSKQEVILCEKLESSLASAIGNCPHDKLFILTDEHTHRLCLPQLNDIPALKEATEIIIGAEDVHKNLETLASVWQALSEQGATRHSLLINLGGGMVTDLGGFAASTFKRGIAYINIPTTLLAQVDSSVGGKTGVNLPAGKNLIGAFHQPRSVIADTTVLKTLPQREISAGVAEIIKYGMLGDAEFFAYLEENMAALCALDADVVATVVARCCEMKKEIVREDERESGVRAKLNLGHTFGHAIEKLTWYSTWLHGEAVAAGCVMAAMLSEELGYLSEEDVARVKALFEAAGLPTCISGLSMDVAMKAMASDKKSVAGVIRFVLMKKIGTSFVQEAPRDKIESVMIRSGWY